MNYTYKVWYRNKNNVDVLLKTWSNLKYTSKYMELLINSKDYTNKLVWFTIE